MSVEERPGDEVTSVAQVLDLLAACARQSDAVRMGDVVDAAGERAAAPLVLVAGLVMLAPGVGDIPGVPVLMGLLVILAMVQSLIGRRRLWLPRWLRRRSVRADRVCRTIGWLRKPAHFLDRWSGPRFAWAVGHAGFVVVALTSIAVALATPIMEMIPFSANLAGVVITGFGLALLTRDGLLALMTLVVGAATGAFIIAQLI